MFISPHSTITNIVNLSLSSGQFHPLLKQSTISPLFKKPTLNKDQLSSYRPISNLSLISKIIERVLKSRLTDYLSSNNLLNPHQSAYCKHHSTETARVYIHDHLIILSLPTLSATFDIDHDILITRLSSWFGIHGSVLNWLKSHTGLPTLFVLNAATAFPPPTLPHCGVPQGSVLGPNFLPCSPPH